MGAASHHTCPNGSVASGALPRSAVFTPGCYSSPVLHHITPSSLPAPVTLTLATPAFTAPYPYSGPRSSQKAGPKDPQAWGPHDDRDARKAGPSSGPGLGPGWHATGTPPWSQDLPRAGAAQTSVLMLRLREKASRMAERRLGLSACRPPKVVGGSSVSSWLKLL